MAQPEQPSDPRSTPPHNTPPDPQVWRSWLVPIVAMMVMAMWLSQSGTRTASVDLPYSEFKALVRADKVSKVTLRGNRIEGERLDISGTPGAGAPPGHFRTRVPSIGDNELMVLLDEHGVQVGAESEEAEGFWPRLLVGLLPWMIILGLYFWVLRPFSRNLAGGMGRGGNLGGFLKRGATPQQTPPDTNFGDVAGQENAKKEVSELVDFLRDPDRYRKLGADVPRGVLLMGSPGTGKTLLARALAGEAGVPFFSISASEFIEVFVGVGASRVRELFSAARKAAPSILFIDELDSVGRVRGAGLGGGHDEREQTLNQILAELDGFSTKEAVIVLAATNRPDVLDPALLRPGRFDRHIQLELPDKAARQAILEIHVRDVPLSRDVDLEKVAAGTPGFSGADLKNLVNEAAMRAARSNHDEVTREDFDRMRDRVLIGAERNLIIRPDERHRLAVHEAGHTAAAFYLPHADPLYKVSIIPRGRALGGTQQLPSEERYTLDEVYLSERLAVLLAGRAAEHLLLDDVSSGAEDDIRQATTLARAMVTRWGMANDIGPVDLRDSEEHPFLGREIAQPRHHSEASAMAVDEAVKTLLQGAENQADEILRTNRAKVERLIAELESKETLYRASIEAVLGEGGGGGTVSVLRPDAPEPKAAGQ